MSQRTIADMLGTDALGAFSGMVTREEAQKLRDEAGTAKRRAAEAEAKIAAVLDLCRDPEQSHRMLTRKEIMGLLR